ncbi:hypothetical protein AKJ50_00655 [candidate division MSBL1 archaeon SCGC-AAA382A13]|uniref:CobQ/CobB/MinD/ParA nucleotide binding domain-containing protein n=1 Tax=candidate division MSBL1 archaeon SCGC-AAA382A13 TaxID=1698279 RepID=A0A133VGH8_9EURY|nr:hypothetical protein AKJ50_00655 [candidate division MSBL1 archaeon SCGC-AAA382A13]
MSETRGKVTGEKTKVIGFSGKGGVGKTTLAALLIRIMTEMNSPVILALDSDPNTCLPEILGSEDYITLSEMIEEYKGGRLPPRKFQQEFNTLLLKNEQNNYDLLPMGKSEGQGCYCSINNLLRSAFQEFILKGNYAYDYVIVDCEAGIEHISRKTSAFLNDLVIVTDGSKMSLNTIKNIYETSQEVKIEIDNIYVIANRIESEKILKEIDNLSEKLGMKFLGNIQEDENIKELNFEGKSVFELSENSSAYQKMKEITKTLISN